METLVNIFQQRVDQIVPCSFTIDLKMEDFVLSSYHLNMTFFATKTLFTNEVEISICTEIQNGQFP
jgi:hypothetical protein